MGKVQTRAIDERRRSRRSASLLTRERELWAGGLTRVAGVDEVGVGPLAGPVVAAGERVTRGQLIAEPGGFVSTALHSPVTGRVSASTILGSSIEPPVATSRMARTN